MKKALLILIILPVICLAQFDKFKYMPKVNIDNSWSGENIFSGEVTMTVITVDTVNYTYQTGTAVVADSIILGIDKEIVLEPGTYIYSSEDGRIDLYLNTSLEGILNSAGLYVGGTSTGMPLIQSTTGGSAPYSGYSYSGDTDIGMCRFGADSLALVAGSRGGVVVAESGSLVTTYVMDGHLVLVEQASLPANANEGSMVKTTGDSLLVYVNGAWMNITTEARATP